MRRIIERNLLRTFKKIYSISDTYNRGLIFRKVSAIYCATQTNDTDQRAGEILRRCTVNHGLRSTWELGTDVNTVQVGEPTAYKLCARTATNLRAWDLVWQHDIQFKKDGTQST